MEKVSFEYNILSIYKDDCQCSIEFNDFKITGDIFIDKRIDFETNFNRYSVNTTGYIIRDHVGYKIAVYRMCRVPNPVEIYFTIKTPEGMKQLEECIKELVEYNKDNQS